MRAVLPNCHSLPDTQGYPSPLQPPLFPSPFSNGGWTFSGSILLVSGSNGRLQLLPKGMQHPRNAPASLSSTQQLPWCPWWAQGAPEHSTPPILGPQFHKSNHFYRNESAKLGGPTDVCTNAGGQMLLNYPTSRSTFLSSTLTNHSYCLFG